MIAIPLADAVVLSVKTAHHRIEEANQLKAASNPLNSDEKSGQLALRRRFTSQ